MVLCITVDLPYNNSAVIVINVSNTADRDAETAGIIDFHGLPETVIKASPWIKSIQAQIS